MRPWHDDATNFEHELQQAHARLARFERRELGARAAARLRHHRPRHPMRGLRSMFLYGSGFLSLATLGVLVVPLLGNPRLTETVSRIDSPGLPLPVALGLLVGCGLLFALGAHLAMLVAGRAAPLLPRQDREHQRLLHDVKRVEAMLAVSDRGARASEPDYVAADQAATIPVSLSSSAPTVMHDDSLVYEAPPRLR